MPKATDYRRTRSDIESVHQLVHFNKALSGNPLITMQYTARLINFPLGAYRIMLLLFFMIFFYHYNKHLHLRSMAIHLRKSGACVSTATTPGCDGGYE
jgi:hypothetical protein